MTISLTVGVTVAVLSPDLFWSDENWSPVEQTAVRTVTGAIVLSSSLKVAGRPITLGPQDADSAWMYLPVLTQLRTWAATPGQQMVLSLRGVNRAVVFRHQDIAIEATPIAHYSDTDASDYYLVTLRLMEIE